MGTRVLLTERFGEVTVDDDKVFELPDGLLGFVEMTAAVLLPVDEDGLFFWLQAVDKPDLAFLVLTPWPLFPDYDVSLSDVDQAALEMSEAGDALVFVLLTVHDDPRRFTANLLGPIVINQDLRRGRQVVLDADLPTQAELPTLDKN